MKEQNEKNEQVLMMKGCGKMPNDKLNEHASESSPTLDPTLDDVRRAVCGKCGRVFMWASEKRWAAGLKAFICRDAHGCKAREGNNGHLG